MLKYVLIGSLLVAMVYGVFLVRKVMGVTTVLAPSDRPAERSVLDFVVRDITGQEYRLDQHRGQVVMIVNVASKCGLTPQYAKLQKLFETYRDNGFVVIGFPANNFGNQEPGTDEQIAEFCDTNFGLSFPMMSKISVKGDDQHEVYRFLTSPDTAGPLAGEIGWNFTKFLVDRNGNLIARFASRQSPDDPQVVELIERALSAKAAE